MRRDPTDRRQPERLAGSFLASLFFHVVLVALLFAVATSSSEQIASESVQGSEVIEISSRAIAPTSRAKTAAAPAPHAPRLGKAHSRPQLSAQSHPRVLHELAKFAPTAPPNPTPVPIASAEPNPVPTQQVVESSPLPEVAAMPRSLPSVAAIAVTVKALPSVAPSPAPSSLPTARPLPRPPVPSAPPATIAPLYAREPHPHNTVAPMSPRVAAIRPSPGVPSPGPTTLPRPRTEQHGKTEQPGLKAVASPGPHGSGVVHRLAPGRPVEVRPMPTPKPTARPVPAKRKSAGAPSDLNARLRALIPTGPVVPTRRHYDGDVASIGRGIEPTPPPEILARTKFMYEESGRRAGTEARIKMYVTSVRRIAGVTSCTGWLLRYPITGRSSYGDLTSHPTDPRYPGPSEQVHSAAIIEPNATAICAGKLQPYTGARPQ